MAMSDAERARKCRARRKAEGGERYRVYLANERFRKRWGRREAWNQAQFEDIDTDALLLEPGDSPEELECDGTSVWEDHQVSQGTPSESDSRARDGLRICRGPEHIGALLGRLSSRIPLGVAKHLNPPDGSLDILRTVLAGGRRLLARLARMGTTAAVFELLSAAGVLDLSPKKRVQWAQVLTRRLGAAATGAVLLLLVDVAKDDRVRCAGAVVVTRLPALLSEDWRSALSRDAATTVEEVFEVRRKPKKDPRGPKLGIGVAYDALKLYRGGESPADIGKALGYPEDMIAEDIRWAVRNCVVTESEGEVLFPADVCDRVAEGQAPATEPKEEP